MLEAVGWMASLNDRAGAAMLAAGAHAATDITGFGLLGHAHEMAHGSRVCLQFDSRAVPVLPHVLELIRSDVIPGGTRDNASMHSRSVSFNESVSPALRMALSDAQTSGGLLISLPPDRLSEFRTALEGARALCSVVGEVRSGEGIVVY